MSASIIKGALVPNATAYNLYEKVTTGDTVEYVFKATNTEINFDLTTLNLSEGAHTFVVQATAQGYESSDYSNEVTYTVGPASYSVTFSNNLLPNYFNTSSFTFYIDDVAYPGSTLVSSLQGKTFNNVKKIGFTSSSDYSDYQYMVYDTVSENGIDLPYDGYENWQRTYELVLTEDIFDVYFSQHSCLSIDTDVTMSDGTTKKLSDIKVGDIVKSWDFESNTAISKTITSTSLGELEQFRTVKPYFKLTFSDGTIIKHASTHRFYNVERRAFVYTIDWSIGEHTYKEDGTTVALVSRELIYEQLVHGMITMDDYTCYFANGLMTGDRRCPTDIDVG